MKITPVKAALRSNPEISAERQAEAEPQRGAPASGRCAQGDGLGRAVGTQQQAVGEDEADENE